MKSQTAKYIQFLFFSGLCLLVVSCAEPELIDACVNDKPSGFLYGLWHGIIAPFSFLLSLFMDNVAVYDVNNNGGWYDCGFLIGAGVFLGGSSKAGSRSRK